MTSSAENPALMRSQAGELLASMNPATDRLLGQGLRCLVAGGLSLLPGVGAATQEALALYREEQSKRNFELFAVRVELLEERLTPIVGAEKFLQSPSGREHVARIFESVLAAEGDCQREALAKAFVSGVGYGRFQPDVVLLFDATLEELSDYHIQVLSWCYRAQGHLRPHERIRDRSQLEDLAAQVETPPAVLQKIVGDLVDARILMDAGINMLGGYWGTLSFSLTSFGIALATYIGAPELFMSGEPELESPFPYDTTKVNASEQKQ